MKDYDQIVAESIMLDHERNALQYIKKGTRILELCNKLKTLHINKETVDFAFAWLEHSNKTPDEIIIEIKKYHKDLE